MQLEVNEINKVFSPIKEELESGLDEKRDLRDQLNAKVRAYLAVSYTHLTLPTSSRV